MKLKPVVASLFVLGLISGPALAKATGDHYVQQAVVEQNAVTSPVCTDNWFNRISIGGIADFVADWGNSDPAGSLFPTNHSTDLFVNNFNILANADINCWTKATLNLAYIGFPKYFYTPSIYRSSYSTGGVTNIDIQWDAHRQQTNRFVADEAYVTFSNFERTPFYAQVGKKYLNFVDIANPYNFVLTPMTQLLGQNNQTAALVGVATDFGLYANAYAFRGKTQPSDADAGNIRNFGAKIGYYDDLSKLGIGCAHYNLNVGWIRAMQDGDFWQKGQVMSDFLMFSDPIGGLSAHGDLNWRQFDVSANFVTALNSVKLRPNIPGWLDQLTNNQASLYADQLVNWWFGDHNTKIWAADINADYVFKTCDRDSKIGLSYQFTGNGQFLGDTYHVFFPKTRVEADYKVNILRNTDFTLSVAHNISYDFPDLLAKIQNNPIQKFVIPSNLVINTGLPKGKETSNVVLGQLSIQF
jgi:hypothetical protein